MKVLYVSCSPNATGVIITQIALVCAEILRFLDTQLGLFEKILRTLRILEKQYVRQLSNRSLFHAGRYLDDMELCYHLQ